MDSITPLTTLTGTLQATAPSVGISTRAGLLGAGTYFVGAMANLLAGGPVEATIAGVTLSFGSLATVMIGRYAQSVKVPHSIENIAKILDGLLEQRLHLENAVPKPPSGR